MDNSVDEFHRYREQMNEWILLTILFKTGIRYFREPI